ncbi:hypothetical protein [Aquipseudomonas alcaligenes]|uniref:Uncharacterized protein n=1 Tax=Aquipseudomonas alcaligenes TaxID=43263 RepID=A0AA42N374_AQUAC|nr:hypothetical protein [Pseudomonas alcaligenes]MDH1055617.1 hypothetical protein [Pseudomonas alcaligenes]
MTNDRKDQDSRREILEKSINHRIERRDIDFGETVRRNVNDVVDTLSPPPRRDKGNDNGSDNN